MERQQFKKVKPHTRTQHHTRVPTTPLEVFYPNKPKFSLLFQHSPDEPPQLEETRIECPFKTPRNIYSSSALKQEFPTLKRVEEIRERRPASTVRRSDSLNKLVEDSVHSLNAILDKTKT